MNGGTDLVAVEDVVTRGVDRDDAELLRAFTANGSTTALGELARRYVDLVYAAARRQVRDADLAEDVTQAVFLLLSRKAKTIRDPAMLAGWLYQTTRFTAANAMKMENRRRHHEQSAAAMQQARQATAGANEMSWSDVSPLIDDAMARLSESDRQSILLHHFRGKSVRETAAAMRVSEEAARKRLARGMDRLRKLLVGKGLIVSVASLGAAMAAARASEAAPIALQQAAGALAAGHTTIATPTAIHLAGQGAGAVQLWTAAAAAAAAVLVIGASIAISLMLTGQQTSTAAAQTPPTAAPPPPPPTSHPTALGGWPLQLSGTIVGSPTPVDLDGDGKLEVVVCYMGMVGKDHPNNGDVDPNLAARACAFHADGSPVAGWPITLMTAEEHLACVPSEFPDWWLNTPAVIDAPRGGGHGVVVIGHPGGPAKATRGATVVRDGAKPMKLNASRANPDPGTTMTLVDLAGDGTICVLGGGTSCTIDGKPIPGWDTRKLPSGFTGSAGDVDGDGHPEVFLVTQRHGSSNAAVVAFDYTGKPLAGWPQKVGGKSFAAPALGNVFGDEKLEVIVPDHRGHILAWTFDGKRFGSTFIEAQGHSYEGDVLPDTRAEAEKCTSIFKDHIECQGPVSLADLDGDGLAEIIAIDQQSRLRAWHGDGSGFGDPDGVIAQLPAGDRFGVSVGGPDASGAFDFFAGASWVHRTRDGHVTVREMVTAASATAAGATTQPTSVETMCQDTITDLDGDGRADLLIGTEDGRVIVFPTGLPYTAAWAQWPTQAANPQHTAVWKPAKR